MEVHEDVFCSFVGYEAANGKQQYEYVKQDKEGRFDLNIDGVSHYFWFRRKKDEFMEALGLPTSRQQNRG